MLFRIVLLVLSLCLGSLARAQEVDPDRLEAVKDFQRYFKKFKEEAQQVEAILLLKKNECQPAATELLKLLKHPNAAVQHTAFAVLAGYRDVATFQPWLESLGALKDDEERATLIKVFGAAKLKAALPAIQQIAADPKTSSTLRFEVAKAMAGIGSPEVASSVEALLGDADPIVRMAAVDCVGQLKLFALGPKIVPLLSDAEWQVRTAAITASGIVRPQAAVTPLIALMREPGRTQIECSEALFRITGMDFGLDADRWDEQWKKLMAIEGWRIPTEEELAKKAESRAKYDALYGKRTDVKIYNDIPTTSTQMMFIIDVSGSMDDLVVERDKFQGYDNLRKFTIVKTELMRTLDTLNQDTNFDIIAFASDVMPWKKKLVPANIINREAAKAWVSKLKPLGGSEEQNLAQSGLVGLTNLAAGKTNTLKALLYPFGIDPDNPPKAVLTGAPRNSMKNKLDTVFFLSDGRPSIGKIVDTIEILKEVKRYNEAFRITFHTIAIGEFQKEFLRDLAAQNGGVFQDLGR